MQLNPYLCFNGQCKAAFEFYAKCLRGEIVASFTFGDTPASEHVPAEGRDRIMHVSLKVGDAVLMGSNSPKNEDEPARGIYVSLNVQDPAEAERIFHAFEEGGKVVMPIGETFWAARFGMVTDKFGTPWMINCEKPA